MSYYNMIFKSLYNLYSLYCIFPILYTLFAVFTFSGPGASRSNESNTSPDTRSINLHTTNSRHRYGRRSAIWLHLHPVVLHSELTVVQSDVLYVWIPLSGVSHTDHNLFGDNNLAVLFPFMRRGLSLVVALFPHIRLYGSLFVYLLLSLLCDQAINQGQRIDVSILRLHGNYGVSLLLADRHNWFLCVLLVHTKDL